MGTHIQKFMIKLSENKRKKILEKINIIETKGVEFANVKVLKGHKNIFRLKIDKIRIIFTLNKGYFEVLDIDYRGNIYKKW